MDSDLYRIWIEDVGRLRAMRHQHTQFNVSLNLTGAGAMGFFFNDPMKWYFIEFVAIAMILANLSWLATDKWFKQETKRKFEQLIELEARFEQRFITRDREGANFHKTNPIDSFFSAEVILPRLAILGFGAMGIAAAWPQLPEMLRSWGLG